MNQTKKIVLLLAAILAASSASAENMRFVKFLSRPVGVYTRVDVNNEANEPVMVGSLNVGNRFVFANTIVVTGGNDTVKGFTSPTLTLTKPANAASGEVAKMKGSIANFNLHSVNVKSGGKFQGGSLQAASLKSPKIEVKQGLYTNNKNIQTSSAWFAGLNMPDKAILKPVNPGDKTSTTWKAIDLGGTCLEVGSGANEEDCAAKLLVAGESTSTSAERCAASDYREQHKRECCCAFGNDYMDEICWTRMYAPDDCDYAACSTVNAKPMEDPECQVECTVAPGYGSMGTCQQVQDRVPNVCNPNTFGIRLRWNRGTDPEDETKCLVQELRHPCIPERNGYTCE